jgi:hypothetical protein
MSNKQNSGESAPMEAIGVLASVAADISLSPISLR